MSLDQLKKELLSLGNEKDAASAMRYFKTGKGQYGEGDVFIGIRAPVLRSVSKKYADLSLDDIQRLLADPIHEFRSTALLILIIQFKKAKEERRKKIVDLYLANTAYINNWDLVDISARDILGLYLADKNRKIIYKLAKSKSIWEQRIAVISTRYFVKQNEFDDTIALALALLTHPHDLIHKAVGWLLREVGEQNRNVLETFLTKHYHQMPRTMLRYAIEKFPEKKRKAYLDGKI